MTRYKLTTVKPDPEGIFEIPHGWFVQSAVREFPDGDGRTALRLVLQQASCGCDGELDPIWEMQP